MELATAENGLTSRWGLFPFGSPPESRFACAIAVLLVGGYSCALILFHGAPEAALSLPLLAVFLLVQYNFRLAFAALILSLFVNVHILWFNSAIFVAIPFAISFVLEYRTLRWKDFSNPLTPAIVLYGVSVLPSILFSERPWISIVLLINVAAFLIVHYGAIASVRERKDLLRIVTLYLIIATVNAIDAVFEFGAEGKRSFGFAGIMFVDLAGLGIILSAAMSLVTRGRKRILLFLVSIFLTVALVLTQTRSIWLVALLALMVTGIYVIRHPELAGERRRRLLAILGFGAGIILGVSAIVILSNPYIEKRATELGKGEVLEYGRSGSVSNSLASRFLIWGTAINAFLAHPVVGIGVYSFPFLSRSYSQLSPTFFRRFVAERTPHQTFIAVLAETGLVGAFGFLLFYIAVLRNAFRSIRRGLDETGKRYAFVGAAAAVYCAISMFVTDAWLWGQLIVVLALVHGLVVANDRLGGEIPKAMPPSA